ncbi:MAG: baeRF10 domain-containing protein [Thermoplasmatota archaeon]
MNLPNSPDLHRLADLYDTRPSFLSLYLDLSRGLDEGFIERRRKECEMALASDREGLLILREALDSALRSIERAAPQSGGLALFCSPRKGFLEVYRVPPEVGNLLVLDSSPYIKPLAMLSHEWEECCVVVLDSTHARIFAVAQHKVLERDALAEDIVRKHRKGGMSQLRFQRLHDGYEARYFKEVTEHLAREVERCRALGGLRGVIIEGPPRARIELERHLPQELLRLVVGRTDTRADAPEAEALRTAEEVLRAREMAEEVELVQRIRSGVLRHGLAAYGFEEVEAATALGRADTIAVQRGLLLRGWRCESCRGFGPGKQRVCPACGSAALGVDAVEELVELAMDKGSRVEFVPAESGIAELGGVGALLRY